MFLRKFKICFAHKKLKKLPPKVAQKNSNPLFSLTASTAQIEEFMFQNVAYRPTVYRTGDPFLFFLFFRIMNFSCYFYPAFMYTHKACRKVWNSGGAGSTVVGIEINVKCQ